MILWTGRARQWRIERSHGRPRLNTGDADFETPLPRAAGGAFCVGKMFAAHAHSGVAAKVPGVLRRIRGAGHRDFAFRGSSGNFPDAADRRLRGHADLGVGQHVASCDAPGGRKPFRRGFTQISADENGNIHRGERRKILETQRKGGNRGGRKWRTPALICLIGWERILFAQDTSAAPFLHRVATVQ